MEINEEYLGFACVQQMDSGHRDILRKLVDEYGMRLNEKINIDGNVYTLHNFNNHCTDLYKPASEVILDKQSSFEHQDTKFSSKELYILNLAILFHDISMSAYIDVDRIDHSKKSADYIEEIYSNGQSIFHKICNLNHNEVQALKRIVQAHSDVRDGNVPQKENGIHDPYLRDDMPCSNGKIRAKLLACILRFADELDITSDRLGHTDVVQQLEKIKDGYDQLELDLDKDPNNTVLRGRVDRNRKLLASLEHWKKLYLFSQVQRSEKDDIVHLTADDEYIDKQIAAGVTIAEIARDIVSVYDKIRLEWCDIKDYIDSSDNRIALRQLIPISGIEITCCHDKVNEEIQKQLHNYSNIQPYQKIVMEEDARQITDTAEAKKDDPPGGYPFVLDHVYEDKLTKEIGHRHYLKVGHFLLDDEFCARDWIDTKEIIENERLAEDITGAIIEDFKARKIQYRDTLIVGLDLEGAILATRVAMSLKLPFSYIIPAKEKPVSSGKEWRVSMREYNDLILITDVVVTYDTLKKALDAFVDERGDSVADIFTKIRVIYCVFYRKVLGRNKNIETDEFEKWKKKTVCINAKFPIEVFKKSECLYAKRGECYALNKKS